MNKIRDGGQSTLLLDGRVLVAGGVGRTGGIPEVELYDPDTGTWTYTGSLIQTRFQHAQTLLADGRVLVTGGVGLTEAEIYDPATGIWTQTGSMMEPRATATANLIADGNVVVIGGGVSIHSEEYDPDTGTWQIPQVQPAYGRSELTTTTLLDGSLLVAGGNGNGRLLRPAERLFYP